MLKSARTAVAPVVAAMLVVAGAAGCGSSASEAGEEEVTIAVEYGALFFPYHTALKKILDQHAEELGGIRVVDADSNQDQDTELSNVENLMAQNPDCLLLIPVDFTSPAAAERAAAQGVPVVSFDQKSAGPIEAFVGYDQLQSGQLLGEFVAQQYETIGKPKIKVMYLRGIIGHPADTSRGEGFQQALDEAGLGSDKVEIIEQATDFDRAKAESVATNLLAQNPDVDVIVGNNDDIVLGALSAAEARGLETGPDTGLHLVGVDGIPEMLQSITEGAVDATVFQNPVPEAEAALEACVAVAGGDQATDEVLDFRLVGKEDAAAALAEVDPVYN
jgi:ABC-type sugar transport system substrate-binding protein